MAVLKALNPTSIDALHTPPCKARVSALAQVSGFSSSTPLPPVKGGYLEAARTHRLLVGLLLCAHCNTLAKHFLPDSAAGHLMPNLHAPGPLQTSLETTQSAPEVTRVRSDSLAVLGSHDRRTPSAKVCLCSAPAGDVSSRDIFFV